ncbi:MAG: site-specific integrase [Gammaproteobacteria bacterium]|nr:site-specific integrase [Pseudomonadales bacterium]
MLYKRPNSRFWWCSFTAPDGTRIQRSTKTVDRPLAQEFEDKLRVQYWRNAQLGEKPRRTWKEAAVRWYRETSRKSVVNDLGHIQWLDPYLGHLFLDEITREVIDQITETKVNTGVKPATVNRLLELVRVILNTAVKQWEWIDRAPHIRMLKDPARRIRWLTREEVRTLLSNLPPHTQALVRFSLATGLRETNVTRLQWSQVDLERRAAWIHPDQSKTGRPIGIPLNKEAVVLLRGELGKHPKYVFTFNGRPIKRANTKVWRRALEQSGIENFRWHDLRHTWASWHVQNGTPMHVLQELGGWSDIRMVQRYAHLAPEHLSPYAETLCELEPVTTFSTTHERAKQKSSYPFSR